MLEKHGTLSMLFLLRWAEKIAKTIGLRRTANAIETRRLMTWVTLQKLNGVRYATLEVTYLGHRYLLVKNLNSNAKWTAQS